MDTTPGRHLAVVGTAPAGADVLRAATLSLARQHTPGDARFHLACLVTAADPVADDTETLLRAAGHPVQRLDAAGLRDRIAALAAEPTGREYLVVFGMDAAAAVLGAPTPARSAPAWTTCVPSCARAPAQGVHLLGWWRGLRRLADDLGGTQNRDDVACLVALNVPGAELALHLGAHDLPTRPAPTGRC